MSIELMKWLELNSNVKWVRVCVVLYDVLL